MYVDTNDVRDQLFEELKDEACYDEAVHHVEEAVVEVHETELESQTQSQGPGHSARRVELLAK